MKATRIQLYRCDRCIQNSTSFIKSFYYSLKKSTEFIVNFDLIDMIWAVVASDSCFSLVWPHQCMFFMLQKIKRPNVQCIVRRFSAKQGAFFKCYFFVCLFCFLYFILFPQHDLFLWCKLGSFYIKLVLNKTLEAISIQ